jgi:hypothetical protein
VIQQAIHEVVNPFDVYVRRLGHGLVRFLIAGSTSSNPQYLVRLYGSGQHRVVDMVDILEYGNPSAGEPLQPPIPDGW